MISCSLFFFLFILSFVVLLSCLLHCLWRLGWLNLPLEPFRRILWECLDVCGVELLDFLLETTVSGGDKVDGETLPAVPSAAADPVDVVLLVPREIIVHHSPNSLNI